MNIKRYSLAKDGEKNVTPNIKVRELRCKDGSNTIKMDYVVVCVAQLLRDVMNQPVIINSAYRTASHNKSQGGTSQSRHLKSCALDLYIKGINPQTIADFAYSVGLIRVHKYSNFVHFDTDRSPRWLDGNFTKINIPYQNRVISRYINNKDYLVAIIQYKLNLLGYNMGKEDGIAGELFEAGVNKFQKDKGLLVDGKVGKDTWNALFNK